MNIQRRWHQTAVGFPTGQRPRVALIEPTQQEHALNKEIGCKLYIKTGIPSLRETWLDWETDAIGEPFMLYDVSRRCTHINLGRSVSVSPRILVSLFQSSSGLSKEVRIFPVVLHVDHKAYVLLKV